MIYGILNNAASQYQVWGKLKAGKVLGCEARVARQ